MSKLTLDKIKKAYEKRPVGAVGRHSFFSVLIPIVKVGEELALLFEVRADDLDRQPGEVCFPGGAIEEGESRRECAIRETCEELGVPESDISVIGQADTLFTYSNITMFCFIGELSVENMKPASAEVKDTFMVPLDYFMENEPFIYKTEVIPQVADFPYEKIGHDGYNWRRGISEVPVYEYEDRVIWGLTARIVDGLVKVLKVC